MNKNYQKFLKTLPADPIEQQEALRQAYSFLKEFVNPIKDHPHDAIPLLSARISDLISVALKTPSLEETIRRYGLENLPYDSINPLFREAWKELDKTKRIPQLPEAAQQAFNDLLKDCQSVFEPNGIQFDLIANWIRFQIERFLEYNKWQVEKTIHLLGREEENNFHGGLCNVFRRALPNESLGAVVRQFYPLREKIRDLMISMKKPTEAPDEAPAEESTEAPSTKPSCCSSVGRAIMEACGGSLQSFLEGFKDPAEESTEDPAEETPDEAPAEETPDEAPAEESTEAPAKAVEELIKLLLQNPLVLAVIIVGQ